MPTELWSFYICAPGYIDNVLLNHGGLPHVPPIDVHLEFYCAWQVRGVIVKFFY